MSTEAQGRLHVHKFENGGAGIFDAENAAVFCDGFDMSPENARRMVACWNSMIGIPTDLLEQYHGMGTRAAVQGYFEGTEQRDRLLAVLEQMVAMIDSGDEPGAGSPWHTEATAAIAACKGGAA